MNRKQTGQVKIIAAICVVLFIGATYAPQINQFIAGIAGGEGFIPFDPVTGEMAPQKFTLSKRGTTTAVEAATVYAWYDWNGNGMVDLGAYPAGEIEELASASTTGLVTTAIDYPIGKEVLYQVHMSGYEIETFSRTRVNLPAAYDGSALAVPTCYLTLTDTGTTRISINGELLVTSSTDYNYTSSSDTEPSCEVVHTSTTDDSGINEQAFTHWGTGKQYAGTFLGITMTNQDFVDLEPDGYSGLFIGASNTYLWWFVEGYFQDADVTGDSRYSMYFNLDIHAAGDFAIIGLYNGVETDDLAIGVWTTVLGTSETDIDIVG